MTNHPIILFDGVCNLCNASVNFLIRRDKKDRFRFTTLQSETARKILEDHHISSELKNSFVLIDGGKAFEKSTAALKLLNHLPWQWKIFKAFWIVPAFLRNSIYDFVARNRYKWFGKRDVCMIPTAELKEKFLE